MRGLTKLERHSNKKFKGKRKRQLETLAANVSGQDFHIDASDTRFSALLDGNDDRYCIDRTNPAFKETGAMKLLLQEQSARRRGNRNNFKAASGEEGQNSENKKSRDDKTRENCGATELSSLVRSIQQKVSTIHTN